MKRNFLWFLSFALLSTALTLTSCDDDPCKDVECGANGTCFDGVCQCNEGYEGTNCELEWTAKFLGSYNVEDVCTGENPGTYLYETTISKVDDMTLRISNFAGFNQSLNVTVSRETASSSTADKISFTNVTDASNRVFNGEGTISGSTITITYTVTFSDNTEDSCTATYIRK